ncbi:hypothetical protein ABID76_001855 [Burkholderia ambifaria]
MRRDDGHDPTSRPRYSPVLYLSTGYGRYITRRDGDGSITRRCAGPARRRSRG